jgi:hypothetical protein
MTDKEVVHGKEFRGSDKQVVVRPEIRRWTKKTAFWTGKWYPPLVVDRANTTSTREGVKNRRNASSTRGVSTTRPGFDAKRDSITKNDVIDKGGSKTRGRPNETYLSTNILKYTLYLERASFCKLKHLNEEVDK